MLAVIVELANRVAERSPPLKSTSTASALAMSMTLSVMAFTSSREYIGAQATTASSVASRPVARPDTRRGRSTRTQGPTDPRTQLQSHLHRGGAMDRRTILAVACAVAGAMTLNPFAQQAPPTQSTFDRPVA